MKNTLDELKGIKYANSKINDVLERIARLRSAVESTTSRLGRDQGNMGEHDRLSRQIAQLLDMEQELVRRLIVCEAETAELYTGMEALPCMQRAVIQMRYSQGMTWGQIAKELHYSPRQCYRLRNAGLRLLDKRCH